MRLVDIQSNLFNKDTEGAVKSVRINEQGVRIKGVKFRQNVRASFPGTKKTVRNNEVSELRGLNLEKM